MRTDPVAPLLLLISGPSGIGKTTVGENLRACTPGLERVVTCTTRPPRAGERAGVDYRFLDEKAFSERVASGDFLEHATVYGHRYGTLLAHVLDNLRAGRNLLLSVDVQGVASIRAQARMRPELQAALVTVFLVPPSPDVLRERLLRRGKDTPETVARRLAQAEREIAHFGDFDYLVVSGDVSEDLRRLQAIYTAERLRTTRALRFARGG